MTDTPKSTEEAAAPKTPRKITELTPDDLAICDVVREKWRALGLSTEPADRTAAEEGLAMAYKAADLEPPKFVIWAPSPWVGALVQACAPEAIAAALNEVKQLLPAYVAMMEQDWIEQHTSELEALEGSLDRHDIHGSVAATTAGQAGLETDPKA